MFKDHESTTKENDLTGFCFDRLSKQNKRLVLAGALALAVSPMFLCGGPSGTDCTSRAVLSKNTITNCTSNKSGGNSLASLSDPRK